MSLQSYKNTSKKVIQVGTKIYSFPRLHYETDASYFMRRDFFVRIYPKTLKEYFDALDMSITWANMNILKCTYRPEVIEHINKALAASVKR